MIKLRVLMLCFSYFTDISIRPSYLPNQQTNSFIEKVLAQATVRTLLGTNTQLLYLEKREINDPRTQSQRTCFSRHGIVHGKILC